MKYLEDNIGKWVLRFRWPIILISIVLVGLAASGGKYLGFSNDSRVFFSDDNPQLKALEALERTYTKDDSVLIVIAPEDGKVFTRETLDAIEKLTQACWQIPHSNRVDSITNFQYTRAHEDDLIVEDLVLDALSLSDTEIREIKKNALAEPLLLNRLVSSSAHVTAINVNTIKPDGNDQISIEVADYVRKMTRDFMEEYPGIRVYLTGSIMIDMAFGEASKKDMTTLIPIMFGMLVLIMIFTLRSISGTLTTLIVILFSMLCGLGMAGRFGIMLTSPSANAPVIIMTLAVADSIHLLVTLIQQMRRGKSKNHAIRESLRINFQPVFLTSLTTGIGFLTMNFSDAPPFRDLGNIVAMGILAAFYLSIFFLPALMSVIPLKIREKKSKSEDKPCGRLAEFTIGNKKILFPGMLVFSGLLLLGMTKIELDDNFVHYFDHRYDFRVASDFYEQNLSGLQTIEYSLDAGEENGINSPVYLKTLEAFSRWYLSQPAVVHVNSISDIMKRLNKNMHGDDPAYYRIPDDRELAAQYLLLYEMSLPFGLDLNNQINVDKSSSRFTVTMRDTTSQELLAIDARARQWLKQNAQPSMLTYGTGLFIIFAHISERNIQSMLGASFGALILISIIIVFALKSVKLGVVSLVPNLLPAFMAFGIWGMTMGRVGLALSVLVALTLGIVVDDTIHFMSKYLRGRRDYDMSPDRAVRYAFHNVGTAIWVTTTILAAGFMVLAFSGFKINSDMGLMTAMTIVMALILDFFFLPTLLMKVEKKKHEAVKMDCSRCFVTVPSDDKRPESRGKGA